MDIASRRLADVVVVAPAGPIDHANAQPLERSARADARPRRDRPAALVLDFGSVGYVSSMGLRVLMVAARALRARGSRIAVAALQPVVAEIFDIARFRHVLEVFPTVATPLRRWPPPRSATPEAPHREARPLLGHARIAAGRAHGGGCPREGDCCAPRRLGPHVRDRRRPHRVCRRARTRDHRNVRRPHVLRRDRDRRPRLRAVRPRQRRPAVRPARARAPRAVVAADLPCVHVPRALGPHHGFPLLHAGVHSGQPHPDLRRARAPRGCAPAAARRAVVPRGLRCARRGHRIRQARGGKDPRDRRTRR